MARLIKKLICFAAGLFVMVLVGWPTIILLLLNPLSSVVTPAPDTALMTSPHSPDTQQSSFFYTVVDLHHAPISDTGMEAEDIPCRVTRDPPRYNVCLHPLEKDVFISRELFVWGIWGKQQTKQLIRMLNEFPEAVLIDLGANIGYFTLLGAAMNHQVIAVEPYWENARRLVKGVQINGMADNVTLLLNAVSDSRGTVSLKTSRNNQGDTTVLEGSKVKGTGLTVTTILLNDLVQLIHSATVIIKLDIEGYECKAMKKADKIFRNFKVPYLLMETVVLGKIKACPYTSMISLRDYMRQMGYHAVDLETGKELHIGEPLFRHHEVYWYRT